MKIERLNYRYFNGSQSVEYTGLYKIGKHKVRIDIDRDSYNKQSSAKASIFVPDKNQWNFLVKIPYNHMKVCRGFNVLVEGDGVFCQRYVTPTGFGLTKDEKQMFELDIETLLSESKTILK